MQWLGEANTEPVAVSFDGSVVVGSLLTFPSVAFRWTSTSGLTQIPGRSGTGCSSDGSVVTGDIDGLIVAFTEGYRWTAATGLVRLDAGGFDDSSASDISANGNIIVGSRGAFSSVAPARWTAATGIQPLGPIPPGFHTGVVTAVSADGSVFAGNLTNANTADLDGFIWTSALGITPLSAFLASRGAPELLGLSGKRVIDISADGNAILGMGVRPDGPFFVESVFWVAYVDGAPGELLSSASCSPAVQNSTGNPAQLEAFGSSVIALDDVELRASNLPPGRVGLFAASRNLGQAPFVTPPGSQGLLCLGSGLGRLQGSIGTSSPAGTLEFSLDLGALPMPGGGIGSVAIGETWYFQAWYRDSNPSATSNLTDVAAVMFR